MPLVLVLAGLELIFFIAAAIQQCFGFSIYNTGMFFHMADQHSHKVKAFLLLTPPHWGCTRSWERTQPGQLSPADLRDIPDCITSCLVLQSWEKKEEGDIQSNSIFLPKLLLHVRKLGFLGDG